MITFFTTYTITPCTARVWDEDGAEHVVRISELEAA